MVSLKNGTISRLERRKSRNNSDANSLDDVLCRLLDETKNMESISELGNRIQTEIPSTGAIYIDTGMLITSDLALLTVHASPDAQPTLDKIYDTIHTVTIADHEFTLDVILDPSGPSHLRKIEVYRQGETSLEDGVDRLTTFIESGSMKNYWEYFSNDEPPIEPYGPTSNEVCHSCTQSIKVPYPRSPSSPLCPNCIDPELIHTLPDWYCDRVEECLPAADQPYWLNSD